MKDGKKIKGSFRAYLLWPIWMSIAVVLLTGVLFLVNRKAGIVALVFAIAYLVVAFIMNIYRKRAMMSDLLSFGADYAQIQKQLLNELMIPYALLDETGYVLWSNHCFRELVGSQGKVKKNISNIFAGLGEDIYPVDQDEKITHMQFDDEYYRMQIRNLQVNDILETLTATARNQEIKMYALYLFNETQMLSLQTENYNQKMVVGLIYLDNYDEVLADLEEVKRSLLVALIDRKIGKFIANYQGILKKLEKDKYIIILANQYLEEMQAVKFSLLEEVKTVNIGNDMSVTLSIGIGLNGETFLENYEFARSAIDLALGRGGDQVVLKDNTQVKYYGGKTHSQEKSTKVRARVKALALRELIESKEKVVIMGHKMSDVDSIGAAIGIYRAAKYSNKRAYIVLDDIIASVRPLLERYQSNSDYEADLFINSEKAKHLVDQNTVLVVVDVNRPSYTECPELLELTKNIVVFDHHRQMTEKIEPAVLSYIEPFASSASEIVAEILQYYGDRIPIRSLDADALYAGIVVDTNNFVDKTGVRTFDAAAFLKRHGADVTRVRKMFRDDMAEYRAKALITSQADLFMNEYAIGFCQNKDIENPNVVAAQAANELLEIRGIKASFVLADYNNRIYISARSIDEVNVQIIMEKLGGGGHHSTAGAQLMDVSLEDAILRLKETLHAMKDNDEI